MELSILPITEGLIAGLVLGFLIGLTGVGGGTLTIPILTCILKLDTATAVGTASFYSVIIKIYAGYLHVIQKTINFVASIKFLICALPGTILMTVSIKLYKRNLDPVGVQKLQTWLDYAIFIAILIALLSLFFDYSKLKSDQFEKGMGKLFSIVMMFVIGMIMGATSVGGGALIVPALIIFHQENSKYVGSSIFIALIVMISSSLIFAFIGNEGKSSGLDVPAAIILSIGSFVGAYFGGKLSQKLEKENLRKCVILTIVIALIMMASKIFKIGFN